MSSNRISLRENGSPRQLRALYSFPHKIGADRICGIAWYQAAGLASAGVDVSAHPGVVHRTLPEGIEVRPTLARGRLRIPYRVVGRNRALRLHDRLVAARLPKIADRIDIVHVWPLGARYTLEAAKRLGIPTVLERPNTHTHFAYTSVQQECERIGVPLPPDHEHAYNEFILNWEEEEYALSDYLICPSDFVKKTFLERGYPEERLLRHSYGFDPQVFYASPRASSPESGLKVLFVGGAAVRKGLHFALEAWLASTASEGGTFLVAGEILPDYRSYLSPLLAHPSVSVLGHRHDVAELMRASDVLVLPSIEEGSALVCAEAMACGCVLLVSDMASGHSRHMENALVHHVADVRTLSQHMTLLHSDPTQVEHLRAGALNSARNATWENAGRVLRDVYEHAVTEGPRSS